MPPLLGKPEKSILGLFLGAQQKCDFCWATPNQSLNVIDLRQAIHGLRESANFSQIPWEAQ